MNANVFPAEAALLAAKVDYPVVNTAVENGTAYWHIAIASVQKNDAVLAKVAELVKKDGGNLIKIDSDVINAGAKADDFYNKEVTTLTYTKDLAISASGCRALP